MKLDVIQSYKEGNFVVYRGRRVHRNVVSQLKKNNPYSLSEPNQRYISKSIEELGKIKGSKNIKFLLNTAAESTYSTNIKLQDAPKNDWKTKLLTAAAAAAAITPFVSKSLLAKIEKAKQEQDLNKEEKEILALREQLLSAVDLEQINSSFKGTMKEFEKNLDYFVISSETTREHKKYVLDRLNYFMSDKYKINPQLKDKKSIVVAEMINDMAIHVPGNKTPNIKAVNQKQHGMCAAISIVRKKLAYEDKPNYVDSILSELDSSDLIMVYDRTKLGSKKKVPVRKVPVDFDTAIANGYRIIDASTMHWMHIAGMTGATNISYQEYTPFDKENFDVKTDTFFNTGFENQELQNTYKYYQSLMAAKDIIGNYKAKTLKAEENTRKNRLSERDDIETLSSINNALRNKISSLNIDNNNEIVTGLLKLEFSHSDKIPSGNQYAYIPNEEDLIKKEKIKGFIIEKTSIENLDDKTVDSIFDLLEMHHDITGKDKSVGINKKINRAKELYEVGAAYRNQIIKGLNDSKTLENTMINEKIVARENLILNTVYLLSNVLNNDSEYTEDIINGIAPLIADKVENPTKKDCLAFLGGLEEMMHTLLDENMEYLYASMGFVNGSKDALISTLLGMQVLASDGNKKDVEELANTLKCKKDKKAIVEKINQLIYEINNGDVNKYDEVSNLIGRTSQITALAETYKVFLEEITNTPEGQENTTLNNFLEIHGIEKDDNEAFQQKLESMRIEINSIASFFSLYTESLKIYAKNGSLIVSPDPRDVILDKLEKQNKIPSERAMKELQEHLTKIAQDRSTDEFQSRRSGKLKDKSLYEFSKTEEKTLKDLEESVNSMYSYVEKELRRIYPSIRGIVENLNREIGVENGQYWHMEGGSGLYRDQQVRILEYMTGRPHYATENLKEAFEKIKTSPYSGITSSSVFHDKPGFHAQYIADIEPVTVEVKDKDGTIKKETREILYQDNSWGPSEAENTWVDSNGNIRTDYSDNRGGDLGYITNSQMRNGNYVDRILGDMVLRTKPDKTEDKVYKKLTHSKDRYSWAMPQYNEVIIEGKSPELRNLAAKIHDTILIPTTNLISNLKSKLQGTTSVEEIQGKSCSLCGEEDNTSTKASMKRVQEFLNERKDGYTLEELEGMIERIKKAGDAWKTEYDALTKRIFDPFNTKRKMTQEEYYNLANNDPLKVAMEKIALEKRYPIDGLEPYFARVTDIKDMRRYEISQRKQAVDNFKYSFSKNIEVINQVAEQFMFDNEKAVKKIFKRYNLNLSEKAENEILNMFSLDVENFNGSLKDTIKFIMNDLSEVIDKHIKHSQANKEVKEYFEIFLKEHSYFSQSDLKEEKIQHIVKFIDRIYDPEDDKEFVKIYRRLQDMTNEEFEKEVLSKVTEKDLGFKEVTGYDILKEIQRHNEEYEYELMNTIFYSNYSSDINSQRITPKHKLKKLYKDTVYKIDYNFETIYRTMMNDLYLLSYPKMFNKWKDTNYRTHGAYPAYPKVNLVNKESVIDYSMNILTSTLEQCVFEVKQIQNQIETYDLVRNLNNFVSEFDSNHILSEDEYVTISNFLGEFVTRNYDDKSITKALDAAMDLLEIPQGATWAEYEKSYKKFAKKMADVENSAKPEVLEKVIYELHDAINNSIQQFALTVQGKYKNTIIKKINELTQAYIKNNNEKIEKLKSEITKDYEKYQLLNNPEELLDSYILSHATDYVNKQKGTSAIDKQMFESYLKRSLDYAFLADIQEIIMNAIKDGTAVKAKDGFKEYPIGFNNEGFIDMGSDIAIATMVDSLFLENDTETAMMFIDKLGLGEAYIRFMIKNINLEKLKTSIEKAWEKSNNYNDFQDSIIPKIDETRNALDNEDADVINIFNNLTKAVIETNEKYPIEKDYIVRILNSINETKLAFEKNKEVDKAFLFKSIIEGVMAQIEADHYKGLKNFSDKLKETQEVVKLVNAIFLPEDSEVHINRIEFTNKYQAMLEKIADAGGLQVIEESDTI